MSDERARKIVGLLIDAMQAEARRSLPVFVLDNWLSALNSVIEKGLYHAWLAIVSNSVEIKAEVVEIIDRREGLTEASSTEDN